MLSKCANPACASLFRSLSHGKLFLLDVENPPPSTPGMEAATRRGRSLRRMERYWLCDVCAPSLTLTFERGHGMVTVPLPVRNTSLPAAHLRRMQPMLKAMGQT